ncbi:hypothetical protein SUGI_0402820 [Cryptomeria japonica]|nr:hypothetical protein SUGI_0402820 [Cryptomeria japonica]
MVDKFLGANYISSKLKYRTNVDVASMFLSWSLELGSREDVKWAMRDYIKEDWKYGLESLLAMACPNNNREKRRAEAGERWVLIKDYLCDRGQMEQSVGGEDHKKDKMKSALRKEYFWVGGGHKKEKESKQ